MRWHALIALARVDLRLFFSNRRALAMSIVAPIVIAAFFGTLFDTRQKPSRVPLGVTDLDRSALSAKVVARLREDTAFEVREVDESTAAQQLQRGALRAAVVLPAGFGASAPRALLTGAAKPVVSLRHDPSQSMVLPLVRGLLSQHVTEAVAQAVFGADADGQAEADARRAVEQSTRVSEATRQDLIGVFDGLARVRERAAAAPADAGASAPAARAGFGVPIELAVSESTSRADRAYNSHAHAFAGMGVQFILFAGIEFGVGLLAMRRAGLWQRLRAAPISRGVLVGSRIASSAAAALVLLAVIYAVAIAAFGVRIDGSLAGFAGVAIAFALLTASFGMLVAAVGRTPEATRGLAILATLLMVMLGGAWVPTFLFPAWLQTVSLAVPTRWAVDGLDAMTWRGLGFGEALAPIGVMLAFSAAFALLAWWRFDWDETPAH